MYIYIAWQPRKGQDGDATEDTAAALDFFGDGRQEERGEEQEKAHGESRESQSEVGSVTSILKGRKRKRGDYKLV